MMQRSLLYRKRTITIVKKWNLAAASDAGQKQVLVEAESLYDFLFI